MMKKAIIILAAIIIIAGMSAAFASAQDADGAGLAETMFGWEETGKKYKINDCAVITLAINGVEKNIICKVGRTLGTIDIPRPDGSILTKDDADIFLDFRDTNILVGKYAFSERYFQDTDGYFNGETDIVLANMRNIQSFIKFSDIPEETKEYIQERIKSSLTLDEIAEILLMLRPINNWYTKDNILDMTESEYANIPDTRDGEYIGSKYTIGIQIVLNNIAKTHIYVIGEYVF